MLEEPTPQAFRPGFGVFSTEFSTGSAENQKTMVWGQKTMKTDGATGFSP